MKTKKKYVSHRRRDGVQIASALVLTFLVALILIPFWNAFVISVETTQAHARHPFSWLPGEFSLGNYQTIFSRGSMLVVAYRSTVLITLFGTALSMGISVMAAYPLSRRFPGRKAILLLMLVTMYFGGGLVPTYLQIKNMGLLDTYTIVVLLGMVSVFNIVIMKNGFESAPMEIQEAAMIDGANDLVLFARIMLPLQKPLIATFSLFTAVGYWNSWYWPMLLLNSADKTTLQLQLRQIISTANQAVGRASASGMTEQSVFPDGIKMASVFVVVLPIMLVYPFLQKYFVKGIMVGAVKM